MNKLFCIVENISIFNFTERILKDSFGPYIYLIWI